jgi:hypothetical protein
MFDRLVMSVDDSLGIQQQILTIGRGFDVLASLHEIGADALFETLDLPADCALTHPKFSRGFGERAGSNNCP